MKILTLNPGGNSLKAGLVQCRAEQRYAYEGQTLLSVSIEGIGRKAELSVLKEKEKTTTKPIVAENYKQAAASFLEWWENRGHKDPPARCDADVLNFSI